MHHLVAVTTRCYGLHSIVTTSSRNDSLLRASNHDSTILTKCQNRDIDLPATNFGFPQRLDRPQPPAKTVQLHPTPRLISAYQLQTSSCISTTRPTPATLVERPAAHIYNSTIPADDITNLHHHTTAADIYIHVYNSGNKIVTFVVSVILPFCLPSLSLAVIHARIKTLKLFAESTRLSTPQQVHPYGNIDTTTAWKKLRFILSVRSDFHMIDSLSIAVHAFVSHVSMSFSVDDTLLPS